MKIYLISIACCVSLFGYTQQSDIDSIIKTIEAKKNVAMSKPYHKFSFVADEKM